MTQEETYKLLVDKRCKEYEWTLSNHVRHVMISLLMTRDNVWVGGNFVQSVLKNNLGDAVRGADDEIVNYLKHMVIARDNFYVEQLKYEI